MVEAPRLRPPHLPPQSHARMGVAVQEHDAMNHDHRECPHSWSRFFGPVLKCQKCGAQTIASGAPGESKPIFKPDQPE